MCWPQNVQVIFIIACLIVFSWCEAEAREKKPKPPKTARAEEKAEEKVEETSKIERKPADEAGEEWPYNPRSYFDELAGVKACDNGILRIRGDKHGMVWIDFYHKGEERVYVNKNNLNLVIKVKGSKEWQNSELNRVQPMFETSQEGGSTGKFRYSYHFPNGAKVYMDITMKKGDPYVTFRVHKKPDSADIDGFQWHVTFGQAEAVERLQFDGNNILADKLPRPFPGGRVEVQHVEWFTNINDLNFRFRGSETEERDPNNPQWMTRYLGLEQHVIWKSPMRPQDHFAFEARDQPWQPDWKVPEKTPWIEGLWFIRNGDFQQDQLSYGIENWEDYSK